MGIFTRIIREVQVNGQTVDDDDDFTVDNSNDDTGADDSGSEAPSENDDADTTGDDEDNFTIDDEGSSEEDASNENADEDEGNDDTSDEESDNQKENTDNNEESDTETTDDDSDDNFNIDAEDTEGGDKESDGGNSGDDKGGKSDNEAPDDPTDQISDEDIKSAEETIYDSLTDDQKRIRVLQLKLDYRDLYDTMINTIEGLNGIPTNMDNIETIKRLVGLLTKSKKILIDYINNNFDKCAYLENYSNYIKYMAMLRTASKVIDELNDIKSKK